MAILTDKQSGVLRGMVTALLVTLLALGLAMAAPPDALLPEPGFAAALAQALRWDALLVACLAINIAMLARHRFFTPDDIDGGGLATGTPAAHVLQATLQNTLEQTVLAVATHAIWAATMPRQWQAAVPAAAVLFAAGRLLFWRGYAHGAPSRAFGFALTFYPSVVMLIVLAARAVARALAG
jgi:hypothetical protein